MWEKLHPELLESIARKLSRPDAIRFSAVCGSWHAAATTSGALSQPLLLKIPDNTTGLSPNRFSLQLHRLSDGGLSPEFCDIVVSIEGQNPEAHCAAVSNGFLLLQLKDSKPHLILFDPFSRETSRLAPFLRLRTWPYIWKAVVLDLSEKKKNKKNLFLAVVFSSASVSSSYCAWCRVGFGAELWMKMEDRLYHDIVARERQLFTLVDSGSVEVWNFDPSGSSNPTKVLSYTPSKPMTSIYLTPNNSRFNDRCFLVESMGEILLVRKIFDFKSKPRMTTVKFRVCKSRLGAGQKWEELVSLGNDRVLFVGRNGTVSVSTSDLPVDYERDSIYFTGQYYFSYIDSERDVGVYNMKHKRVKIFPKYDSCATWFWMVNENRRA